ncbi:hypothetical protein [Schlesneria paludicola]|uniref:hypothetical protein n=1 Tax=Schlesneria paludicola TaxID=360056 RepID=UPI00029B2E9B|nr:hypothetical protein [Schlesneria paludicola]
MLQIRPDCLACSTVGNFAYDRTTFEQIVIARPAPNLNSHVEKLAANITMSLRVMFTFLSEQK